MSELVREALRHYMQRQEAIAQVDELLLEGLRSGKPSPVTKKWLQELKAEVQKTSPKKRK